MIQPKPRVVKTKAIFAKRLLNTILSRGISYEEISAKAGVTYTKVVKFISSNNQVKPTLEQVSKLAEVLEVDEEWLRGYNEPKITLEQLYPDTPW